MSAHYIEQCKRCDAVISQCRCPDPRKRIIKMRLCDKCRDRVVTAARHPPAARRPPADSQKKMHAFIDSALCALLFIAVLAFFLGGAIAAVGPPDDPATKIAALVAAAGALIAIPILAYDEWVRGR